MTDPVTWGLVASALTAGGAVHQATKGTPGLPKVVDKGDPESLLAKRKATRAESKRRAGGRTSTVLGETLG